MMMVAAVSTSIASGRACSVPTSGPGTEWLEDARIDPRRLPDSASGVPATGQARPFDILLLKGSVWQGNAAGGSP